MSKETKEPKPRIETKTVKHTFTPDETAKLNVDFRQAYANVRAVVAEFDGVKATYKAKQAEAESRMATLDATLQAGFTLRDERCLVVLVPKESIKKYYLETDLVDGKIPEGLEPALTENMTPADFQADLIEAESKFDLKEEIALFPATENDNGILIVGRLGKSWYGAIRVKIGTRVLTERLDSEQPSCKKRPDAVKRAVNRFSDWLTETMGKDEAKGFDEHLDKVIEAHKEREE